MTYDAEKIAQGIVAKVTSRRHVDLEELIAQALREARAGTVDVDRACAEIMQSRPRNEYKQTHREWCDDLCVAVRSLASEGGSDG